MGTLVVLSEHAVEPYLSRRLGPFAAQPGTITAPFREPGASGYREYEEARSSISVVKADNTRVTLLQGCGNSFIASAEGGTAKRVTNNFSQSEVFEDYILTEVVESRVEKSHIADTFGDAYVYFFGERPIVLKCMGFLANSENHPWLAEFIYNYENFFRGTRLLEMNAKAFLRIDEDVYEGYMMDFSYHKTAPEPLRVPFSFTFYVTKVTRVRENYMHSHQQQKVPITRTEAAKKRDEALRKDSGKPSFWRQLEKSMFDAAWRNYADPVKLWNVVRSGDWRALGGGWDMLKTAASNFNAGMLFGVGGAFSGSRIWSDIEKIKKGGWPEGRRQLSSFASQMGVTKWGIGDEFKRGVFEGDWGSVGRWVGPSSHKVEPK